MNPNPLAALVAEVEAATDIALARLDHEAGVAGDRPGNPQTRFNALLQEQLAQRKRR